jgi:molybdenum cofactor cytidylyltransferase
VSDVAAIVLAAGRGERLGVVAKALLGTPTLLERVVGSARAAGVTRVVVVVGPPHGERVATAARALGAEVAVNPAPERGMVSSLAAGVALLGDERACLSWPVDVPGVTAATVRALCSAATPDRVTVPSHEGHGGHPVALGRALWSRLPALVRAPGGLRALKADPGVAWSHLSVDDAGVLLDVDTPADLARLEGGQ